MSTRLSAIDRRQQILEAASGIFARKGYEGSTTREIAEQAGVNEALLFRHFPTKENLYWTLIEELCATRSKRSRIKQIVKHGGCDQEVFESVAREILSRTESDRELTRLLWFTALENHGLSARLFNAVIADYFEALASHVRERIRQGAFRKTDPLLAARGFLGMVAYHFLIQELFGGEQYQKFNPAQVARTLSQIWLAGMQNSGEKNGNNGFNGRHARAEKKKNEY
jgi:AcrR family transcriptional regulator